MSKLKVIIITVCLMIISAIGGYIANGVSQEKLVIASRFGQLRGVMMNTNYAGMFELMTSDFAGIQPREGENYIPWHAALNLERHDWSRDLRVYVDGDNAVCRIQNSKYFAVGYYLKKEKGVWKFTGNTYVQETALF